MRPRQYRKERPAGIGNLINEADKARIAYNRDMAFKEFADTWNIGCGELLGWTLTDFYRAYYKNGKTAQLSLSLA